MPFPTPPDESSQPFRPSKRAERQGGPGKHLVDVGAIGRPQNDGQRRVWYALLTAEEALAVEFEPVYYDHELLVSERAQERLPGEFIERIRTDWWTTCLEMLPAKERARGRV